MKKILFAIAAVATLFATSCKKESVNPAVDAPEGAFVCTIDNGAVQNIIASGIKDDMGTMTTIPDGRNIFWKANDVIHINGVAYTATTVSNGQATFTTTGTEPTPTYYAFYGDNLESFNADGATLKSSFAYDNDNNAENLPMYATGSEKTLTFSNICAVLEIKIPAACTEIQLSANTNMSGAFTVNNDGVAVLTNATGSGANITVTGSFTANQLVYVAIPEGTYSNFNIIMLNNGTNVFGRIIDEMSIVANKIYPVTSPKVKKDCFYFVATAATTITLNHGSSAPEVKMEYIKSPSTTSSWTTCSNNSATAVNLSDGDTLYFRSTSFTNQRLASDNGGTDPKGLNTNRNYFTVTGGNVKMGGKLMYLINSSGADNLGKNSQVDDTYAFANIFNGQSLITDITNLKFPKNLSVGCFHQTFMSCSNLCATSITLPATTLPQYCYYSMFNKCMTAHIDEVTIKVQDLSNLNNANYYCMKTMFNMCYCLKSIKMEDLTTISSDDNMLYGWTYNVGKNVKDATNKYPRLTLKSGLSTTSDLYTRVAARTHSNLYIFSGTNQLK